MRKAVIGLVVFGVFAWVRCGLAGEVPPASPEYFRTNPALPSPADLVVFDDSKPVEAVRVDSLGANQGAFPANYGGEDGAAPAQPARRAEAPVPSPTEVAARNAKEPDSGIVPGGTAEFLAMNPPSPGAPALPPDASVGGYVDYQSWREESAGTTTATALPRSGGDPLQTVVPPTLAGGSDAPAIAAKPADAGDGQPAAPRRPEPTPMPPPLPELSATQQSATPYDIAIVRADFNRLKTFCETDSLGSAAEIYAGMPDFGQDEEVNRLRADAANLLVLGLSRADNLGAARRIYDSVPLTMPGYDANLAKARGVINLATYYVRAERYNDAYEVLMDVGKIQNRSALNNELFRLMARMIPYLDNADSVDKALNVYDLLLDEVRSPGTAALFADNLQGVVKYYLHYVDKSENPNARRRRMLVLEHIFESTAKLDSNADIKLVRKTLGESLAARYAGDPERAMKFFVED